MTRLGLGMAAACAALGGAAHAQGVEISAFGGVNFAEERIDDTVVDVDLVGFGPVFSGARIENDLDAGATLGAAAGWRWEPDEVSFLSVIVEGEVAYRSIDDQTLANLISAPNAPAPAFTGENFDTLSFGPNVRAKFTLPLGWFAYAGGGLGVAIQDLNGDDDAGVYGQGMIGGGFRLFDTMELGIEYRAFATRRELRLGGSPVVLDVDTVSNEILGRVSFSF